MVTPLARHAHRKVTPAWARVLRLVGGALAVVLVSTISLSTIVFAQLQSNITSVTLPNQSGAPSPAPGVGAFEGEFDMLFVGSDECVDSGGCEDRTERLNDFTMLLHVAADHQSAVAVTFPRDMIVPIPACPREDGNGNYPALSSAQINVSFSYGGLPCTALTLRQLTGVPIVYAGVMNFNGVREISTAIGGVDVCIDAPIKDSFSGLDLPTAGAHTVQGEQALQFLRTRYGIGDGSDTGRIGSQQAFLSSMLRKIKSEDTLTDPGKVLQLATAASRNMTLSDNVDDVTTLASMALALRDIPLESITFVKYPAGPTEASPNRVFPDTDAAAELFRRIAANEPVAPDQSAPSVGTVEGPDATTPTPSAEPSPTVAPAPTESVQPPAATDVIPGVTGQTAAQQTCAKAND